MQTIPKRSDLYTNPTQKNFNLKEQMSELLEMRNILTQKFQCLNKIINNQTSNFIMKNTPSQKIDINSLRFNKNLFGTDKSFKKFSQEYKEITFSLDSQIKGVVQILEKFSFTKSLSIFITEGVVTNFMKIHDLMLQREQYCTNVLSLMQNQVLNKNLSIFAKTSPEKTYCLKCINPIEKSKIQQTKDQILFGGRKIKQFLKKQLKETQSDEQGNSGQNIYEKISGIKKRAKKQSNIQTDISSEDSMKFHLNKLQSNLQQRKFDILACLMEMGQFGNDIKNIVQKQNIQKVLQQKQQKAPNFSQQIAQHLVNKFALMPKSSVPSKFNFNQFTFDIGKHFQKQIQQIQKQLSSIKKKYNNLMTNKSEYLRSSETQCNLIKDSYQKELQKYKKKTDRQVHNLNTTIKVISEQNKKFKGQIQQYQNVVKVYICSKLQQEKGEIQKIRLDMKIPKLIQRYQKKVQDLQVQIKQLKQNYQSIKIINQTKQITQAESNIKSTQSLNQLQNIQKLYEQEIKKNKKLQFKNLVRKIAQKSNLKQDNGSKTLHLLNSDSKQLSTDKSYQQLYESIQYDNNDSEIQKRLNMNKKNQRFIIQSKVFYIQVLAQINKNINRKSKNFNKRSSIKSEQSILVKDYHDKIQETTENMIGSKKDIGEKSQTEKSIFQRQKLKNKKKSVKIKSQNDTEGKQQEEYYIEQKRKKNKIASLPAKKFISQHETYLQRKQSFSRQKLNFNKKKSTKALSVSFDKKDSQQYYSSDGIKLPMISSYQTNKNDKLKQLQKTLNKNSLLTKKKRKNRNFSQQNLKIGSIFQKPHMKMSMNNRTGITITQKQKAKKQYIIDFIPKIQDSNCKNIQNQNAEIQQKTIDMLFNSLNETEQIKRKQKGKGKYLTKIIQLKRQNSQRGGLNILKPEQLSLATKIYSFLVIIKSKNYRLYLKIRQKLKEGFDIGKPLKRYIKNNCDQISLQMGLNEQQKNHFPLSMSINPNSSQDFQLSQVLPGIKDSLLNEKQIKNNQKINKQHLSNQIKMKQSQQLLSEDSQLRNIINQIILNHSKHCGNNQNTKDIDIKTGQQVEICTHLKEFMKFLKSFTIQNKS